MIKNILLGIITGFAMLFSGMAVSKLSHNLMPGIKTEYENAVLFRSWKDPLMSLYWFHPFFVAFILLWVWNYTKSLFKGESPVKKGLSFGLAYWVFTLPGMLISYSSFQISVSMIISWTAGNLVQAICAGLIFSKLRP